MRKTHVKGLPLGAIIFVLLLIGGVFPSMAQAVVLTINFGGSGTGKVEGSPSPSGAGSFTVFSTISNPGIMTLRSITVFPCHPYGNSDRTWAITVNLC